MKQFKSTQTIPITLEKAWEFFSSPQNLRLLTPPEMNFTITSKVPEKMYSGLTITYTVSPIWGIPMKWMSKILEVEDYRFFVDVQVSGPFAVWHHQHTFKEVPGGVEMTDIVSYKAPLGFLGSIVERLMLDRRVAHIFEYRRRKISLLFAAAPNEHL